MSGRPLTVLRVLFLGGFLAFALAALSIVDMYLPRSYDGVVLEADSPGRLVVREVVVGSGAAQAGIRPGDRIIGIDRTVLRSTRQAATLLQGQAMGTEVAYLLESSEGRREVLVELGRRRIGNVSYLSACLLGFSFFAVGLFVLLKKPQERVGHVFFLSSTLFLLFLVCRLRPASYSGVDQWVLFTGTLALLFLPGTFLHFYLIFPRPVWEVATVLWLRRLGDHARLRHFVLTGLYLFPALVYVAVVGYRSLRDQPISLISGAPRINWWVLGLYMLLGLGALTRSARRAGEGRERRGILWVLFGSLFGLLPFLLLAVAFPSFLHTERFLYLGIAPLVLVPITFAYAIVRFGLLDIRIMLSRSLLYTVTTALVTGIYALGIVGFNHVFKETGFADSPFFPIVFALAIVLLIDPLRRRLQGPVDRFFFAGRARLQEAMIQMGNAFSGDLDPGKVARELVEKLPQLLNLHWAALYLEEEDELRRVEGPAHLPEGLPLHLNLRQEIGDRKTLLRIEDLGILALRSEQAAQLLGALRGSGTEAVGNLSTSRRQLGLVLLSSKANQMSLENTELSLLRGLLQQAAIALETSHLLAERTHRAELERELLIAASIQSNLLPSEVTFAPGWDVAVTCRPARQIGGDFITELPASDNGDRALVYGDVAGKSVPAALLMMAAQEVLQSLAMTHREPEALIDLANQRLYALQRRSFVALGYLVSWPDGQGIRYLVAGQPHLLKRRCNGEVEELPLAEHRLPLGALPNGGYRLLEVSVLPGELILGCSDGVLESQSIDGRSYGSDRLCRALAAAPPDPRGAIDSLLADLQYFSSGREAYDDMTLVALSRPLELI